MKISIQTILTKTRQGLENLYGKELDKIILFGSQARGDARPDSDIDILIVLKHTFNYQQESDHISHFIANLCLEHNVLISCALTTREKLQQSDTAFFRNIRREGILV